MQVLTLRIAAEQPRRCSDKALIVKIAEGGCSRGSIEGGERYTHGASPSSSSASQALQARRGATKEMGGTGRNAWKCWVPITATGGSTLEAGIELPNLARTR